ncbi:MAG: DUF6176 family protein [Cyanophyceae cyanobacterium]
MLQVQCLKIPILPDKVNQLRHWLTQLSNRHAEVLEALRTEGFADGALFLSTEGATDFLYIYSRAQDLSAATAEFQDSLLPLDIEFKCMMSDCLDLRGIIPLNVKFAADLKDFAAEQAQSSHYC